MASSEGSTTGSPLTLAVSEEMKLKEALRSIQIALGAKEAASGIRNSCEMLLNSIQQHFAELITKAFFTLERRVLTFTSILQMKTLRLRSFMTCPRSQSSWLGDKESNLRPFDFNTQTYPVLSQAWACGWQSSWSAGL